MITHIKYFFQLHGTYYDNDFKIYGRKQRKTKVFFLWDLLKVFCYITNKLDLLQFNNINILQNLSIRLEKRALKKECIVHLCDIFPKSFPSNDGRERHTMESHEKISIMRMRI